MKKFKFRGSVVWKEFPKSVGELSIHGGKDAFGVWESNVFFKTVANNSAEIYIRQGIAISKFGWSI